MSDSMPQHEFDSHYKIIKDFLSDWGYYIDITNVAAVRFRFGYGLKLILPKADAITDIPGKDGQTNEYFLRDCLKAAHKNVWKRIRDRVMTERAEWPENELQHWDGGALTRWAFLLQETEKMTGRFALKNHDPNCTLEYIGGIECETITLKISEQKVVIKQKLPSSVLESIKMEKFGRVFSGFPLCKDKAINDEIADLYIMKAEAGGNYTTFHLIDSSTKPMPNANPSDLWRRIKAVEPDTVLLQFPPYADEAEMKQKAFEHRSVMEALLSELPSTKFNGVYSWNAKVDAESFELQEAHE